MMCFFIDVCYRSLTATSGLYGLKLSVRKKDNVAGDGSSLTWAPHPLNFTPVSPPTPPSSASPLIPPLPAPPSTPPSPAPPPTQLVFY